MTEQRKKTERDEAEAAVFEEKSIARDGCLDAFTEGKGMPPLDGGK